MDGHIMPFWPMTTEERTVGGKGVPSAKGSLRPDKLTCQKKQLPLLTTFGC